MNGGEIGPLCPSAQPDWDGASVIGIVVGTATEPHFEHLAKPLPVTEDLLAFSKPVTPAEVFRFAAPCINHSCAQYSGSRCQLAEKVVKLLPVVATRLPSCTIRPRCRWWQQEGKPACLRCEQVVTDNYSPSAEMRCAADPRVRPEAC